MNPFVIFLLLVTPCNVELHLHGSILMPRAFGTRPWCQPLKPKRHRKFRLLVDRRGRRISLQVIRLRKILRHNPRCLNPNMAQYSQWYDQNDQNGTHVSRIHRRINLLETETVKICSKKWEGLVSFASLFECGVWEILEVLQVIYREKKGEFIVMA